MSEVALCSRCVLPSNFPGAQMHQGICSFCAQSPDPGAIGERKAELAIAMRQVIEARRGTAEYDCVVAFSGGKDSSYTLMLLVREFGLNCLAITIDNGFISEQAVANCKAVTAALGVDFVTYTPAFAFMRTMYVESLRNEGLHTRSAIRRASSICNSCINLINTYMLKTAARQGIPIVAGGYVGGQVPKDAVVLHMDLATLQRQREAAMARQVAAFGPDARRHFDLGPEQAGTADIAVINPMLAVSLSEDEIVAAITPLGWKRTADTGLNSSNCRLNDLGIAMHYNRHRFHPYAFEISEQIRAGMMTREEGLRKVRDIPALSGLSDQFGKLELQAADAEGGREG